MQPIKRQTLTSAVTESLRKRILSGEFTDGQQLRQEALSNEYGVSRVPVREALRQLEAEGLIQIIDLHEMRTINDVLRELKGYGIHLPDLYSPGAKDGETFYPFRILQDDHAVKLTSLRELLPELRELGERGMKVTRFKGLGEMDAEELWSTTMDPGARTLLKVTMVDAAAADEMFRVLMGDAVEPRREFIEKHALDVKDLDV